MPHWNPPSSQNARWTGCRPFTPGPVGRPATVAIFWPRPSRALRTVQPLTAFPSTSTAHAPHCARSQPRFEFERPSWKFIVSQRLSRLSTTTSCATPSMLRETRRMVAGRGPRAVAPVVVVVAGETPLVATTAPPRTTPAAAAPAPAPTRNSRRVTPNDFARSRTPLSPTGIPSLHVARSGTSLAVRYRGDRSDGTGPAAHLPRRE